MYIYSRNETIFKIGHPAKVFQNNHFDSKIKFAKNMQKPILQPHKSCSVEKKTARENQKYSRNGTIFKIGHFAKGLQNGHFDSKIKFAKNMHKPILQPHLSCSIQ